MTNKNLYHDESMWKGAPPENFGKARHLRANMTEAEIKLWQELQSEPFKRFRFRRQHPIQTFIVDFYSHKLKLIIEVDGEYHETEEQQTLDKKRTEVLQYQGLEIIRFSNKEVLENLRSVLKELNERITSIQQDTFPGSL